MDNVASLLIKHDLYEQVETAVYGELKAHADEVMQALREWPVGTAKRVGAYGCVMLSRVKSRRMLRMSSLAMSSDQYDNTLLHEVAHIIAWLVFDARGHGYYWRRMAALIGVDLYMEHDPKFMESIAAHRVKKTKLVALCPSCDKKWHRMRSFSKRKTWWCPSCKTRLHTF